MFESVIFPHGRSLHAHCMDLLPGAARAHQRRQIRINAEITRILEEAQAAQSGSVAIEMDGEAAADESEWAIGELKKRLEVGPPCRLSYNFPAVAMRLLAMTDEELTLDGFYWATGMNWRRNWLDYSSAAREFLVRATRACCDPTTAWLPIK